MQKRNYIHTAKATNRLIIFLVAAGLLLATRQAQALIARGEIDSVRSLNLLTEQDLQKVQTFVNEQFRLMAQAKAPSDILNPLRNLTESTRSTIKRPSIQMAYSNRYAQAVKKSYKMAFSRSVGRGNQRLAQQIQMAAAVVVAKTESTILIDDMANMLKSPVQAVRYWAAKGLAMPAIRMFFAASTGNAKSKKAAQLVATALQSTLQNEQSGLVIGQIAQASPLSIPAGTNILDDCVAKRLDAYKNWQIEDELIDWQILQRIFDAQQKNSLQPAQSRTLMLDAAKLYTAACERYKIAVTYKGSDGHILQLLPQANQNALQTILIEGEKDLMLLAKKPPENRFENTIKSHRWSRLNTSLSAILRVLNQKLNIYPKGTNINTPLVKIPAPPQKVIERAQILREIKSRGKVVGNNQY